MLRTPASLNTFPTTTWAALPAAASAQGLIFRVTDYGVAGVGLVVISDGTRWLPVCRQVLGRASAAASVTGTAVETTLASVAVPPNLLGLNGRLEISAKWSYPNNANTKTMRARFGGSVVTTSARTASNSDTWEFSMENRNATGTQLIAAVAVPALASNNTNSTIAVDSTQAQNFTLTAQLGVTTDTNTLESFILEVMP